MRWGAPPWKLLPAFAGDGREGMDGDVLLVPHQAGYNPAALKVGLSELLRVIQLYNVGGYRVCAEGEDGFCPGG